MSEHDDEVQARELSGRRLLLGILLIAAGMVPLSDEIRLTGDPLSVLARVWPFLIIAIGLTNIIRIARRPQLSLPIVLLICSAVVFFYLDLFLAGISTLRILWPLVLIFIGYWTIIATRDRYSKYDEYRPTSIVRKTLILQEGRLQVVGQRLRLASVRVLFGVLELDITNAEIASSVDIHVSVVFARVDIIVPPGLRYRVRRFSWPRPPSIAIPTFDQPSSDIELNISVIGFYGDITIRTAHFHP